MLLTIDAGNTRTKWAVFDHNGEILRHGACANEQLSTIDLDPQSLNYQRIIISNVAGSTHASLLAQKLAPYKLPVHWISAEHSACNIINGYTSPETLGTDRWAALIAAWHIHSTPCVVVNAGTAVTIDALSANAINRQMGEFLGGMILPGLSLMQTSLGLNTAQLPKNNLALEINTNKPLDIFAKSTAHAITAGILHAVTGAIIQISKALELQCGQMPYIIISGGDAPVIQRVLNDTATNPTLMIDNLVLQGLYLMDRSKQ